ncbi:MAG: response regulator [Geobacteraceae bacterium]|nr:response regulator [Geobacteraceae bacterium]
MKRILIVDDIPENRYLLEMLLKGSDHEVMSAENGAVALKMARHATPDLIVADILMPVMDGYSLCRQCKTDTALRRVPFIFYTATYTEPEDQDFAMSLGADRFVTKPQEPEELKRIVEEVLEQGPRPDILESRDMEEREFFADYSKTLFRKLEKKAAEVDRLSDDLSRETEERKKLQKTLFEFESKLNMLLDASTAAIILTDMEGNVLFINKRFSDIFGYGPEDLPTLDTWFVRAFPDVLLRRSMQHSWRSAGNAPAPQGMDFAPVESRVICRDGTARQVSVMDAVISDIHLTTFTDLTERRKLEDQLLHAQKMEAIGQLAGGVVHDFNNILTAIVGYGHLLMTKLPDEGPSRGYVEQILSVTDRGAKLTHSIFAFSRKQKTEIKPVKLNHLIHGAESFLRRLINESIELKTDLSADDVTIMADPFQIEQIIMNLVTNARDAISDIGSITIRTRKVEIDEDFIASHGFGSKGNHVLLMVSDTGEGMDTETSQMIFEPFFTTKEAGRGTGLGLTVVYGIVKRHGGHIQVDSAPGKGTDFRIYLPCLNISDVHDDEKRSSNAAGGSETILLAEDNDDTRRATRLILEEMGYQVVEAANGEQALALLKERKDSISLVLADLVMPRMGGWEVYREAVKIKPDIRIIFTSGYTDDSIDSHFIREAGLELLPKPVPPTLLSAKIREALDKPQQSSGGARI